MVKIWKSVEEKVVSGAKLACRREAGVPVSKAADRRRMLDVCEEYVESWV
jgi:hypothetical protein